MSVETDAIWLQYAQRKRAERLSEAEQVWNALAKAGGGDDTVLAVDFVHFGPSQAQIAGLSQQLCENYTVTIESGPDGYWLLKATTRPYGITLSAVEHVSWVRFMCDVADSHGCVFSTWSLCAPSLTLTISSEAFGAGS